jgi:hypothetical protein
VLKGNGQVCTAFFFLRLVQIFFFAQFKIVPDSLPGPQVEKDYIKLEAQRLFHENKNEVDPRMIDLMVLEAQCRLELALHYKIPYPRPSMVDPGNVTGEVVGEDYLPSLQMQRESMGERFKRKSHASVKPVLTKFDEFLAE